MRQRHLWRDLREGHPKPGPDADLRHLFRRRKRSIGREEVGQDAQPLAFDELLARSDFVSLHCQRYVMTLRLMDAAAYRQMKEGAIFISTARGGIHDEAELAQALRSGHLAGAGLDVWDQEPPPLDYPLLAMDNVFATFHTAGV